MAGYSAFQPNAFQNNAFQIARNGTPPVNPKDAGGWQYYPFPPEDDPLYEKELALILLGMI